MEEKCTLYAGTYAKVDQVGIYRLLLDRDDGSIPVLKEEEAVSGISNPSFLTVSSDGRFLYAVMEDMTYQGSPGGGVAAFQVEGNTPKLLNTGGTGGTLPCHLLLDERRGCLYVANYMSGSVSMFRIEKDGRVGELCDFHQHSGFGLDKERQEGPHVHYIGFAADGEGIWSTDLGIDRIKYYKVDEAHAKLIPDSDRDIVLPDGVGPRHFVLDHHNRDVMYAVCELSSEVIVIDCGQVPSRILQRISTLPQDACKSTCAAVHLSEDGRFLYVSNRGDDSIAVFAVGADCILKLIEIVKTQGQTPRDFCLCKDLLLSANQDSDTITVFRIDRSSGRIADTGVRYGCEAPVCLIINEVEKQNKL